MSIVAARMRSSCAVLECEDLAEVVTRNDTQRFSLDASGKEDPRERGVNINVDLLLDRSRRRQ